MAAITVILSDQGVSQLRGAGVPGRVVAGDVELPPAAMCVLLGTQCWSPGVEGEAGGWGRAVETDP